MNGRRLKINQEVEEGRCRCCAALRGANSCYFPNPRDGVRAPCLMCPSGNLGLEGRVRLKMSFPNEVGFRFSIVFASSRTHRFRSFGNSWRTGLNRCLSQGLDLRAFSEHFSST